LPAGRPYLSSRVVRNEDARLLTGRALFVDDVQLPGMLHVAFVRSQHAHGRLKAVDVSVAKTRTGVHAIYTAKDLGTYLKPSPALVAPPPIPNLTFHSCTPLPLASGKVRYTGEPVAMVVAASR
jgi:CO/xanthine dehydrogenase Mo-binding subunit